MERGHWDIDGSASVNVSQWFRYSDIIHLHCSTRRLTCFWAIFHRLPSFKQTPVWLGRSSKNMNMDEPESWNHFAIDSLSRLLLEQSAAIIASLKKRKKKDAVGWRQFFSLYCVQSVSSFRHHLHCIAGETMDFPDLKTKTSDYLFRSKLTSRACEPRAGLIRRLANRD